MTNLYNVLVLCIVVSDVVPMLLPALVVPLLTGLRIPLIELAEKRRDNTKQINAYSHVVTKFHFKSISFLLL